MPHISKENILELSSMSNEVKAYLEKLYPELFEGVSELLKIEDRNLCALPYETPLDKAERLYKKGTTIKSYIGGHLLTFEKAPKFIASLDNYRIHDKISGFVVREKGLWIEILEP